MEGNEDHSCPEIVSLTYTHQGQAAQETYGHQGAPKSTTHKDPWVSDYCFSLVYLKGLVYFQFSIF